MKSAFKWLFLSSAFILALTSCKKDKVPVNEEELITTVKLNFTEVGTSTVTTATFRDIDGEGGNPPSLFETVNLLAGRSYQVRIELLNESVSPAENITDEVVAEANDHQFYFQPSGVAVAVTNLDTDGNGFPLGVNSVWKAAAAGTGTLRLTLKHKPGIKANNDPVTVGDTDIELYWYVQVN